MLLSQVLFDTPRDLCCWRAVRSYAAGLDVPVIGGLTSSIESKTLFRPDLQIASAACRKIIRHSVKVWVVDDFGVAVYDAGLNRRAH